MAKGTATPDKIKRQKETAEAIEASEAQDASTILKNIEKSQAEALKKFEAAQKEERARLLSEHLTPLKTRRSEASREVNELNTEIAELDRQIAKLTGEQITAAPTKRRGKNKSKADKLEIAAIVYGSLKDTGKRHSAADLKTMLDGVTMKETMKLWNEAHPDKKISVEGATVNTRYFVGK